MIKKQKKKLIIILVLLLISFIVLIVNPLIGPTWLIRANILRQIPIGTSIEDVIKIVEKNKKWEEPFVWENNGINLQGGDKRSPNVASPILVGRTDVIIGEKAIEVYLGGYHILVTADVTAYFAFDEDGKLIDVFIRKDWDSL